MRLLPSKMDTGEKKTTIGGPVKYGLNSKKKLSDSDTKPREVETVNVAMPYSTLLGPGGKVIEISERL